MHPLPLALIALCAAPLILPSYAATPHAGPQAATRTYAQNYKDMVLASCLAQAYRNAPDVAGDAGSSVSALRDWTMYDLDASPLAVQALIDRHLARDYTNPVVEAEIGGIRFDFLKCLDLYHSKELQTLVKQLVLHPERTSRVPPLPSRTAK